MKTRLTLTLLLLMTVGAAAQTSKREMYADPYRNGSTYFAYPGPVQKVLTPAPAGYEPFYISHYGRHGSRYMTSNKYYVQAITPMDSAAKLGLLTPKGEEVLAKLKAGYADAYNRDGDLTALGGRQHREIAHRMYDRFPELLSQPLQVDARASTSRRVMISMFNFCWELQGLNPDLEIRMDASEHDMPFVVSDSRVKPEVTEEAEAIHKKFSAYRDDAYSKPERLMKVLFKDVRKVEGVRGRPRPDEEPLQRGAGLPERAGTGPFHDGHLHEGGTVPDLHGFQRRLAPADGPHPGLHAHVPAEKGRP